MARGTQTILAFVCAVIILGVPTLSWIHFQPPAPQSLCASRPLTTVSKLSPYFMQQIPTENNPNGVGWYTHLYTSTSPCLFKGISGLLIQQTSKSLYAEVDLLQVDGKSYDQTNFSTQAQLTFINPNDPANPATLAGLLVQSPAPTALAGGFTFLVNTSGQWQLRQWDEGNASSASEHILESKYIALDPHRPIALQVRVQHGMLYGYINGSLVVSYRDDLPKPNESWPRQIGLVVERYLHAPSSQVLFSHFALDTKTL